MKKFGIILITLSLITSCGLREKPVEDEQTTVENMEETSEEITESDMIYEAVVKDYSERNQECGMVLEIKQKDGNTIIGDPGVLADEYAKVDTRVRITYHMSRRPTSCELSVPIIIDSIEKM